MVKEIGKKVLFVYFVFCFFVFVGAESVDIDISFNKEVFNPLEVIEVSLILKNTGFSDLNDLTVLSNFEGACAGISNFYDIISLKKGEERVINFFAEAPDFSDVQCEVVVSLIGQDGFFNDSYSSFVVRGGLSSLSFDVLLDKKTFVMGESAYINYSSDVSGLNIESSLIYPDGFVESIVLPTLVDLDQVGIYSLNISVSKEGYSDLAIKEQFGVIAEEVEVREADLDQREEKGSTSYKYKEDFWEEYGLLFIFLLFIIIFIIIIYVLKSFL